MKLPESIRYLVRPVPLGAAQAIANAALKRVLAKHAKLFDRLGEHVTKSFSFSPTDLPLVFVIVPRNRRVTVLRPGWKMRADVSISGPLITLLSLAEGRLDGDAEFFSRDLSISGDMEAAVALRNAMDNCRIDLPVDLAPAGSLRYPIEASLRAARSFLVARSAHKWS